MLPPVVGEREHRADLAPRASAKVGGRPGMGCTKPRPGSGIAPSLASSWITIGRWSGWASDQASQLARGSDEGGAGRAVVDLLDVEDLEARLLHHGDRAVETPSEPAPAWGRRSGRPRGVLEDVELDLAQAEVELLGQRRVRVLEAWA